MTEPTYYIWASDPHGVGQPWINLIQQAQHDFPNQQTIFGGDYIDGNKYSKTTVDFVIDQVKHHQALALLGNHEQMMTDFVEYDSRLWYLNGAKTTVKSFFGRGFPKETTRRRLRSYSSYLFLKQLPKIIVKPNFIFVHAGIACWLPNDYLKHDVYKTFEPTFNLMNAQDYFFLWSRQKYFYGTNQGHIFAHNLTGKAIVTGHTPTMLISGGFDHAKAWIDNQYDWSNGNPDTDQYLLKRPCPVKKVQYPHEAPRYFTDDGCHGNNHHHGNICVFNSQNGQLIKTYNDDTGDIILNENNINR